MIFRRVIETLQLEPLEIFNGVERSHLNFRIEILFDGTKYTALLWRIELYDVKPTFEHEFLSSEMVMVLDETTISDINEIKTDTKSSIENLVVNRLAELF